MSQSRIYIIFVKYKIIEGESIILRASIHNTKGTCQQLPLNTYYQANTANMRVKLKTYSEG